MRIVFMGTPDFAAVCLKSLHAAGHEIAAVYTKPDQPKGRGNKLTQSPVKVLAKELGLPVEQPASFREEGVCEGVAAYRPELIVAVAYGKLLPRAVLEIPPYHCVNIHGSILPQLRGSGPVQWSILNHLDETGVTAMYMAEEMDAGDIIAVKKTAILPEETAGELMDRMAVLGAELLCETVAAIAAGTASRTPQNGAEATFAPMLTKDLCPIDWSRTRRQIRDQVRGLIPWPVATAELGGKKFKIFKVTEVGADREAAPGTLLRMTKKGLEIACGDGTLCVAELQAEGGKRMPAADYFRGHPIALGE